MKNYQKRLVSLLLCLTGGLLLAPSVQAMGLQEEAGNDSVQKFKFYSTSRPVTIKKGRGRYQFTFDVIVRMNAEETVSPQSHSLRLTDRFEGPNSGLTIYFKNPKDGQRDSMMFNNVSGELGKANRVEIDSNTYMVKMKFSDRFMPVHQEEMNDWSLYEPLVTHMTARIRYRLDPPMIWINDSYKIKRKDFKKWKKANKEIYSIDKMKR